MTNFVRNYRDCAKLSKHRVTDNNCLYCRVPVESETWCRLLFAWSRLTDTAIGRDRPPARAKMSRRTTWNEVRSTPGASRETLLDRRPAKRAPPEKDVRSTCGT